MSKVEWKPGTMIYPLPAVMVSCGDNSENYNIITISWTGTVCTDPALCYISVRKSRHSHALINNSGEFVINLTTKALAKATDWCGVKSGKDFNKFKEMNLTPEKATHVSAPMIAESPVNIECKVISVTELGSHDMFLAEVLAVHADETFIDKKTGAFRLVDTSLISYLHGHYYELGKSVGHFGFSVKKKQTRKRS